MERGPLSLAQVEEELRSAEAYLTASERPPPTPTASYAVLQKEVDAIEEDSSFRRKLKSRPVISEERRKEILAKLSSERQTALRSRHLGGELTDAHRDTGITQGNWTVDLSDEKKCRTPEERNELIQKLLSERNVNAVDTENVEEKEPYPALQAFQRTGSGLSSESSGDEIYYASDILGNGNADEVQPRSKMDLIFEGNEDSEIITGGERLQPPEVWMRESMAMEDNASNEVKVVPSSLFSKLLAHASTEEEHISDSFVAGVENKVSREIQQYDREEDNVHASPNSKHPGESEQHFDDYLSDQGAFSRQFRTNPTPRQSESIPKKPFSRIDFLAQPRNYTFAEREKQRLQMEMAQLQECTFQPNVLKPSQRVNDFKTSHDGVNEPGAQNVVQRLHLDGTERYDSRERARGILEAQQLQQCTFKPRINETSKAMFTMVDYKPIQHRVSDLQRAKAESIERIREQLDREEYGPLSFTPSINPKSREIASNKLAVKEVEDFGQINIGKPKTHKVTDRLAEDAEAVADRKLATQEYYDMVNDQPFAPKISEISRKIAEQKPEFKMDFVSRQQYFQSRDMEKMEALEGFCDIDYVKGQRLTFKPDIGNAEGVLKQLRPDRCTESSQQKLYRLTYNDQRQAELKKQQLREKQYAQYTFKPEINPVSKVLGKSSTLDELAHPVRDIQQTPPVSKQSPPQKNESGQPRVALQYFANKRFRSRVALEMEEASKAECTFQPNLVASRKAGGSSSTSKLYSKEPRSRTKLEWQSGNLLHLIEAERQKKADEIEAKRNAQELKELEECTFRPNIQKSGRGKKASSVKGSPSPPRGQDAEEKPVVVRGLGRFLELRDLARKQQADQKQREQKVFEPNTNYEPRSYTVPKPFKLSETSKDSIRRRLKVREEMRAKEREECTFQPQTVSSRNRRVIQNMLNN